MSVMKTVVACAVIALAPGLRAQWNGGGDANLLPEQKRFERLDDSVRVLSFLQDHRSGVYSAGEGVSLELVYSGRVDRADLKVIDFFGGKSQPIAGAMEAGRIRFVIPGTEKLGHYTCEAELFRDGKSLGYSQTAYAVLPEADEPRDPFFMIDKNCIVPELLPEMKRAGFGSLFQLGLSLQDMLGADAAREEAIVSQFRKGNRSNLLAQSDFHINLGCATHYSHGALSKKLLARVKDGMPLFTEEECRKLRRIAERVARETADLHPLWLQQDEWDAICYGEGPWKHDYLTYLAGVVQTSRNISRGLKAGDPAARYGMPGICCNDYMWAPEPFEHMSYVLAAMRGDFDFVSLDAYSGGWRGGKRRFRPPEHLLRDILGEAARLSKRHLGAFEVAIAERCQSVPYAAAFDSYICRSEADMVARAMILSKAVTNNLVYSHHFMAWSRPSWEYETATNKLDAVVDDFGLWKFLGGGRGLNARATGYVPRPILSGVSAAIHELSFVSEPRDFAPRYRGRAAVTFRRPDGRTLAALWNIDERTDEVEVELPAPAELIDLMGNCRKYAAGRVRFSISASPRFLIVAGERTAFEQALRGAFPIPNEPKRDPRLKDSIPR